jgi:hypothetical protein
METALIILLWVAIIAVLYYPLKNLAVAIRKIGFKQLLKDIAYAVAGSIVVLSFFKPELFTTVLIVIAYVYLACGIVYPLLVAVYSWRNRSNPEALKQLNDRVNKSIANADKYGQ